MYVVKVRVKSHDVPLAAREPRRFTVLNGHNVTLKKKTEVLSVRRKRSRNMEHTTGNLSHIQVSVDLHMPYRPTPADFPIHTSSYLGPSLHGPANSGHPVPFPSMMGGGGLSCLAAFTHLVAHHFFKTQLAYHFIFPNARSQN